MTSIALTLTVKDERDLLRPNILYHRYLGVSKFYVFLDGTTDDTRAKVADLGGVELSDSISGESFLVSSERRKAVAECWRLRDTLEKSVRYHTARQVLNSFAAWEQARDAGIDWLISLDADELVWPGTSSLMENQLSRELSGLAREVEQVRFPPLEVIPRRCPRANVFREGIYFKRSGSRVRREVYDPFRRKTHKLEFAPTKYYKLGIYRVRRFTWWYGHRRGKWAVRLGPSIAPSVHQCCRLDGKPLNTVRKMYLLHYLLYSYNDFIKKYRNISNQPNIGLTGIPVQYRKRLWRDIVNSPIFSEALLQDYYKQWIAFGDEDIAHLTQSGAKDQECDAMRITAVRDVFNRLAETDQNGGTMFRETS